MLHRIWSQAGDLLLLASVALIFGIVKCLASPEQVNWRHQIGSILTGVVLGTMAGALAMQWMWGDWSCLAADALVSLLSKEIILAVLNNKTLISDLVKQAATNIVNKLTGTPLI